MSAKTMWVCRACLEHEATVPPSQRSFMSLVGQLDLVGICERCNSPSHIVASVAVR